MLDKEIMVDTNTDIVDEGFMVEPMENVDEGFLVDSPIIEEEVDIDEGFLIEQEPQEEIVIDEEMQVEICGCGKCVKCHKLEIELADGDEELIKEINKKYEVYKILEKANINQELWDECKVIDGVIYTPQIESNSTDLQTMLNELIISRL